MVAVRAGRAGADLHVHRHHNDIFYVLEGELTVMLGLDGEHVVVPAGTVALCRRWSCTAFATRVTPTRAT